MNYEILEKVICDTIKEEQIKLGYEKETIRLYYPMSSLANILEEEILNPAQMDKLLAEFASSMESKLGKLEITHKDERYCILIPPEGAAYVHEHYEDNPFLVAIIEVVRQHDCTLEKILKVFHSYSEQVECEQSKTDEFDYVIYFTGDNKDEYRYCFKFEHGHAIYHRFLKKDFQNLYVIEAPDPIDPEKEQSYKRLTTLMQAINCMRVTEEKVDLYKQTAKRFTELAGYKSSEELAEECKQQAKLTKKEIKKKIYKRAQKKLKEAKKSEEFKTAALEFRKIPGYKDADSKAAECDALSSRMENRLITRRLVRLAILLLCTAAFAVGANVSITRYYLAGAFQRVGSYERALKLYDRLDTYRDSEELLAKTQYAYGLILQEKKEYAKAVKNFAAAGDYKDSQSLVAKMERKLVGDSEIGDTVKLAGCKWKVLNSIPGKALLMKEEALPAMSYHSSYEPVTWENSSLRAWLNSEYLTANFTEEEQENVVLSNISNEDNPSYGTDGGDITEDRVFLLSVSEAEQYQELFPKFKSNSWLRTPGNSQSSAAFLAVTGSVMQYGYDVSNTDIKVRPVIWFRVE